MQKKQLLFITAICIIVAFATSGAAFYYQTVASELKMDLDLARKRTRPVADVEKKTSATVHKGTSQECERLQEIINRLRGEKRALVKQAGKGTVSQEKSEHPMVRRRMSFQERLEDLKQTDPEKYEKIQAHFQQVKERMAQVFTSQKEFISSLEGMEMTPEQLENHEALKEKLARVDELNALINSADLKVSLDARRELHLTLRSVKGLLESERDVAMESLGKSLGYDDEALLQFTNYIKKVNKMTSGRAYRDAMRGNRDKQKRP